MFMIICLNNDRKTIFNVSASTYATHEAVMNEIIIDIRENQGYSDGWLIMSDEEVRNACVWINDKKPIQNVDDYVACHFPKVDPDEAIYLIVEMELPE